MKRTTLLLILTFIAAISLTLFLQSCSTLRTERDVLRVYGTPYEIDTAGYNSKILVFKSPDGGTDKFGIGRDSSVFFHLGF